MKYAKFGLIILSALSLSGCGEDNAISETLTDSFASVKTSVTNSLGDIPETFSLYANAPETSAELLNLKQQLTETQQQLNTARQKLQTNTVSSQSLQQERSQLRKELKELSITSRHVQKLKQQFASQSDHLGQLEKVLSETAAGCAVLSADVGHKGQKGNKIASAQAALSKPKMLQAHDEPRAKVKTAVQKPKQKPRKRPPTPVAKKKMQELPQNANNKQKKNLQEMKKLQRQKRIEQQKRMLKLRKLQQQKRLQRQKKKLLELKKLKQQEEQS